MQRAAHIAARGSPPWPARHVWGRCSWDRSFARIAAPGRQSWKTPAHSRCPAPGARARCTACGSATRQCISAISAEVRGSPAKPSRRFAPTAKNKARSPERLATLQRRDPAETERPARYVKCPACQKIMNRVNFGRTSGVIVDVCKPHGVWFERDELRRVLAFTANGGLEQHASSGDSAEIARLKALNLYGGDGVTVARQAAWSGIAIRITESSQVDATSPWATLFSSLFT